MYNIIQLNDKELSELQAIAKEQTHSKKKTLFIRYSMNKQS